jgi:exodeoxyribonuclease-3
LTDPPKQEELKVINWNVLYGFNHKKSIEPDAAWIRYQNPDVLGLQELNKYTLESLSKMALEWGRAHSVRLKQKGFPAGLTSKQPIEVIERRVEGFHHGYLHCKTCGFREPSWIFQLHRCSRYP